MMPPAAQPVRSTCPYCGVGCGVLATRTADGSVDVAGDPAHPANFGKLCSKGLALAETLATPGRLLQPEIGGRPASWDAALDLVAQRLSATIARCGQDAVGFYVSGQLLTEDYYVANKLMKGFIGSANIDTNSRLCMASSVAGHRRAFGEDIVPGIYEDLDEADLVVLAGSNAAWCHPILHQRILAARRARGTLLVVIDPRRTASAADADLHLQVRPGMDVLLFNSLLVHLAQGGAADAGYIERHTSGFQAALAAALADVPSVEHVAAACGLEARDLRRFHAMFAATARTVTVYSQGINQSAHGTDKVNAILNCHLATGRIGRPGATPFSVTGQPNAMGGREVGGLANQLAAHMDFGHAADIERVARFWRAPNIARRPGLKAVDLFRAAGDGRIKALWIMGTNPVASMPDAGRVRRALQACDFVVASDVVRTETTDLAHVLLPAAAWGEKDGTVTNSERRLSRQRRFLAPPGEARPDWRIVCDVAARMGYGAAFAHDTPAAIFREHAALSALDNHGARLFDLGALAGLEEAAYETAAPRLWPARHGGADPVRLFADGRFPLPGGRARFVPVRQQGPALLADAAFPLVLNTGRLRDQWHTMTRTGRVARLMANAPEPQVDLHPHDAAAHGVADGELTQLTTRFGTAHARVRVSDAQRRGEAFLPMHWSARYAANAAAGTLSAPVTDPWSGQPELKHVPLALRRQPITWAGVLITRRDLVPAGFLHWSRRAVAGGWSYDFCGAEAGDQGVMLMRALLDAHGAGQLIEYTDQRGMDYRAAVLDAGGCLQEALLVAAAARLPARESLLALFGAGGKLESADRLTLLSGRPRRAIPSSGRVVCACFNVGVNQIGAAVATGCRNVDAIGEALRAGTNCGACRAEIRSVIEVNLA